MQIKDEARIMATLAPLIAIFPNWKPEPEAVRLYSMILSDMNSEILEEAIVVLLTEPRDFMPTPGTIRDAALDLISYRDGDPNVYTAWSQVMDHFNRRSSEAHPLTEQVVKLMGGWNVIGLSDNLSSERARFVDAYREMTRERKQKQRMLPRTRKFIGEKEEGKLTGDTLQIEG